MSLTNTVFALIILAVAMAVPVAAPQTGSPCDCDPDFNAKVAVTVERAVATPNARNATTLVLVPNISTNPPTYTYTVPAGKILEISEARLSRSVFENGYFSANGVRYGQFGSGVLVGFAGLNFGNGLVFRAGDALQWIAGPNVAVSPASNLIVDAHLYPAF